MGPRFRHICFLALTALALGLIGCWDQDNPSAPSVRYKTFFYGEAVADVAVRNAEGVYLEDATVRMTSGAFEAVELTDEQGEATLEFPTWEMKDPPDNITLEFSVALGGYEPLTEELTAPLGYVDVIRRVQIDRDIWGNTTAEKHITNYIYRATVSHTFVLEPLE